MGLLKIRICFSRRRVNGTADDADLADLRGFSERDAFAERDVHGNAENADFAAYPDFAWAPRGAYASGRFQHLCKILKINW